MAYYSAISLEGLRKSKRNHSQCNECPGKDSNRAPSKFRSFTAGITCSQSVLACVVHFLQQTDISSLNSKLKGKDTPVLNYEPRDDIWGVEVYLHTFQTTELHGGE
jgi:hypothetical protein